MASSDLQNTSLTFFSDTPGTDVNSRLDASTADEISLFADNATNSGTVSITNIASLEFAGSTNGGTNQLTITVPATITTSYTLTFPPAQGTLNQFLINDGSGNLSWSSSSSTSTFTDVNTATYNILTSDQILGVSYTTTGTCTLTLPAASSGVIRYYIKDTAGNAGTNNITINPTGADSIDNTTTVIIQEDLASITLISDGTADWYIV